MTLGDLVDETFDREGRVYADQYSTPPIDQPTGPGGVTLATLTAFRGRVCTVADLKALGIDEAARVIRWRFEQDLIAHGFELVKFEPLQVLLLDTAYNSGEGRAVRWLQRLVGMTTVDGVLGPATAIATNACDGRMLTNAYVAQRAHAGALGNPTYRNGLIARALAFVIAVDDK